MNERSDAKDGSPSFPEAARPRRKVLRTQELLEGSTEVILLHADEEYRLRVTRLGKLILTK